MVVITDKFGKASIDTDYAIATTTKTARSIGVTVLEAFDLSKFSDDTPVYFVTYKKTTDVLTGAAIVTDLVSWKAIVNTGANTLTNLTLAPGYTDLGNDVGDFIECIPTSYWVNSLIEGIFGGFNPDGTLKKAAILSALDISSLNGYVPLGYVPNTVTYNGNGSYDMVFNGVNLTNVLSNGMRLKTERTVAAPTRCTSLNGTNQYYSRPAASVAGVTFTVAFSAGSWVKLSSYVGGQIIARQLVGVGNGWNLETGTSGQIAIAGCNGANYRQGTTSLQIPLDRWVHIVATLDMAGAVSTIYINGISVPVTMGTTGSPSSLVQSGDLTVGAAMGGSLFLPGKIAQAFVASKVLSPTEAKAIYSQGITTADIAAYSIVSAFSFDNSINDLNTSNANNLTVNNGATATDPDSFCTQDDTGVPNGINDFAIVTKKAFSTNTTITVQAPEGCTIPTSGGITSIVYSSNKVPFGFPNNPDKWTIYAGQAATLISTTSVTPVQLNSMQVTIPVGAWSLEPLLAYAANGGDGYIGVSPSATAFGDLQLITRAYNSSGSNELKLVQLRKLISLSTAKTYFLVGQKVATNMGSRGYSDDLYCYTKLIAVCAYL